MQVWTPSLCVYGCWYHHLGSRLLTVTLWILFWTKLTTEPSVTALCHGLCPISAWILCLMLIKILESSDLTSMKMIMANTVFTNRGNSFEILTSLAEGSVQGARMHMKMLAQNANTFQKKTALKLVWNCSRLWEQKRWILGGDCLGKASVNHSLGRIVGWGEGDLMAVAFSAHPGTQAFSLFQWIQQCQQDKVLSYPPNQLS